MEIFDKLRFQTAVRDSKLKKVRRWLSLTFVGELTTLFALCYFVSTAWDKYNDHSFLLATFFALSSVCTLAISVFLYLCYQRLFNEKSRVKAEFGSWVVGASEYFSDLWQAEFDRIPTEEELVEGSPADLRARLEDILNKLSRIQKTREIFQHIGKKLNSDEKYEMPDESGIQYLIERSW